MELRAVPAKRLLAPLAVLVPIGATPMPPTAVPGIQGTCET
jgi:hypothetical protein